MKKYLVIFLLLLIPLLSNAQNEPCSDKSGTYIFQGMNVNWENLDIYLIFKNSNSGEELIFIRSSDYESMEWPTDDKYQFYIAEYDQEQGYLTYLNNDDLIGKKYEIFYTTTKIDVPCDGINTDSAPCPTTFAVICSISIIE